MPGIAVRASRNSNCEAPVAAMMRALPLLCIASFLMSHNQRRHAMKTSKATNNRRIISVTTIPVNLSEVLEQTLDEIECVGPLGMTRELDPLEGGGGVLHIQFAFFRH